MREHILHPELSPEQVAWSFAVGLAMAWNPLLGTHTGLVLLTCFLFRRLHRPLLLLATFINNPWTTIPMATASAYFGNILLGKGLRLELGGIHWKQIGLASFTSAEGFRAMHAMLRPILLPYLLGGFALTALSIPVGYFAMRWLTNRLRRIHWQDIHLPHPHLPSFHRTGDPSPDESRAEAGQGEDGPKVK
ncbi:MAG: DUF2062 domain-containing protein [Acidobacteria bacterium]|nr:DUF2062 domain-containing protein [Acidobacteriota bacterium]